MIFCGSLMNAQIYSSGNLSTGATSSGAVAAPAGYTWSELQAPNTSYGASGHLTATANFRLADDFVVPAGESWAISSVEVFAYQTGSTSFPVDQLTLQIWNGSPVTPGTVVFGNTTTNILNVAGSTDSFMYRIAATLEGTTRRIWKMRANVSQNLLPGTYYLDYQAHATNGNTVFFPPVTNLGSVTPAGANALQANAGVWAPLMDTGSGTVQALPFIINYIATSLGTTETRQLDSRVVVYPNPTVDLFKLSIPSESLGAKTEVGIYDQSGKKVKSFKVSDFYDVRDLASGLYLVKINDGLNVKVTKLIKK